LTPGELTKVTLIRWGKPDRPPPGALQVRRTLVFAADGQDRFRAVAAEAAR
jgi:hypothetical protein